MSVLPFNFKPTPSAAGGSGRAQDPGLRLRQMVAGLSTLFLAAGMALAGPAGAADGDPAGNNGTIKIDGVTFDDAPDNEPHPGCSFQVDFYGFDEGAILNATVVFAVHNPTGGDDVLDVDNDVVFIGEDGNDGGGSEAGLDASERYDLYPALTEGGYEPGPRGYHIKLTVHADGSIGADTKHKVFWVTDCEAPVVPPVDDDDEIVEDKDDTAVVGSVVSPTAPPVLAGPEVTVSDAGAATPTDNDVLVLGETLTRPDAAPAPAELARTGAAIASTLVLAAILLMLGTLARRFGRSGQ